jgi:subtilase family serine protease
VAVSGTEAAVSGAFGTDLRYYRVDGAVRRAPQTAVTVPAAAAAVLTVVGLATGDATMTPDIAAGQAGTQLSPPAPANRGQCSRYWGQRPATGLPPAYGHTLDYDLCGYVPPQLAAAYGVAGSGLTGQGVTIAVVDPGASSTIVSDVNTYMRRHGGQPLRPGQLTQYLPPGLASSCGTELAPYGEEHLDVEAAHAMAPDADIAYVAADCSSGLGPLDAETEIVDHHLADIVSDSWGFGPETQVPAGIIPAFEQVFEQGATEGIGFYFSSGDQGDWSPFTPGGQTAVQYPGSDPWVTSVGGTTLATGPGGRYKWEIGWGEDIAPLAADAKSWTGVPGTFYAGAGGGPSELFAQPSYQRGIVPAALSHPAATATAMRVIPDIAADADSATGMLIGLTEQTTPDSAPEYVEVVVGGTSESTPLIAGIQADAQQARRAPIGFANPAIYDRYHTPAYHDVTDDPLGPGVTIATVDAEASPVPAGAAPDYLVTLARDTSLHATPGYDDVTGVGTPTAAYLGSYRWR